MHGKTVLAILVLAVSAVAVAAQDQTSLVTPGVLYCSGVVTNEKVPQETYLITGEQSNDKLTFDEGDYVYVNKGAKQGAKVGDEFLVIRPVVDTGGIDWTKWQSSILHKMGTVWADEGRLKVIVAQPDVSIAQVEGTCDPMQRGDYVVPFTERPVPPLKPANNFDRFAPPNGKPLAMIITGKRFQQQAGTQDIIYVNLGTQQGVKVGDYFRIFRYQGTEHETAYTPHRNAFDVEGVQGPSWGFGRAPSKYNWSNVPREDVGEGIVLRTGPNSSTVLITFALREVFPGDYVEIE